MEKTKRIIIVGISLLASSLMGCSATHDESFLISYDYNGTEKNADGLPIVRIKLGERIFSYLPAHEYDFLVPGDSIKLNYTGSLKEETGGVSTYSFAGVVINEFKCTYTDIVEISEDAIERLPDGSISYIPYGEYDQYVILDKDLSFCKLEEYRGTTLYGSSDLSRGESCPEGALCGPKLYPLGGLFAFDPRPSAK